MGCHTQIKNRSCGACSHWNPPQDKHWRYRVHDQRPGWCERGALTCRDDFCSLYRAMDRWAPERDDRDRPHA